MMCENAPGLRMKTNYVFFFFLVRGKKKCVVALGRWCFLKRAAINPWTEFGNKKPRVFVLTGHLSVSWSSLPPVRAEGDRKRALEQR